MERLRFALLDDLSFLRALDLSHTGVVHDDLDNAVTEGFDLLPHEGEPFWLIRVHGFTSW
jgi:hypothetical protein